MSEIQKWFDAVTAWVETAGYPSPLGTVDLRQARDELGCLRQARKCEACGRRGSIENMTMQPDGEVICDACMEAMEGMA